MQSDDPPFLVVGTEVSAKFKGAFCEAKVKKIVKSVKCKVLLKEAPFGSVTVEDVNIRGKLELNQLVEITQGKNTHKGLVQNVKDCSMYTVVFNDGDERVLRRTQVCLKGAKHFDEAVNLDSMPLYHPESFASSISGRDMRKKLAKRKTAAAPDSSDEDADEEEEEDGDDEETTLKVRRSNSTLKTTPTKSPSITSTSLRMSARRASSVTPLKGIASTRSATRAIAALKYGDTAAFASKSPTPARSIQQSPLPPPRASSVMVSVRRIAMMNRGETAKSLSASEAEDGGASEDEHDRKSSTVERAPSRNSQRAIERRGNSSNTTRSELSNKSDGLSASNDAKSAAGAARTKKKTKNGDDSAASSSSSRHAESNGNFGGGKATSSSTATFASRLMASTVSSREKATVKTVGGGELSKYSSSSSIASSSKDSSKEPKREKKSTSSTDKSGGDAVDDKRFPPGSVVVINEFVPPKIGGRIHLGMVVSVKEYRAHPLSNKLQQLPVIGKRQIPVRIFQNGRYHAPYLDHISTFNPVEFRKLTDTSSPCVKIAFERANLYYTKKELPQSWEKRPPRPPSASSTGTAESSTATVKKEKSKEKDGKVKEKKEKSSKKAGTSSSAAGGADLSAASDDDAEDTSSSSDEEEDEDYNERRDRFVAHFYKFQDESGNPMNRVPVLGGREIDLYRFYDVVNRLGGHKRVTLESRWRRVLTKLRLEDCSGATPQTVKNAYLRYFEKFEAFMKHLGYSSLNGTGPSSTFSRSSRSIRTAHEVDWKKSAEKRKEKRAREKSEIRSLGGGKDLRASSKDSSVDAPPLPKAARLSTPSTASSTSTTEKNSAPEAKAANTPAATSSSTASHGATKSSAAAAGTAPPKASSNLTRNLSTSHAVVKTESDISAATKAEDGGALRHHKSSKDNSSHLVQQEQQPDKKPELLDVKKEQKPNAGGGSYSSSKSSETSKSVVGIEKKNSSSSTALAKSADANAGGIATSTSSSSSTQHQQSHPKKALKHANSSSSTGEVKPTKIKREDRESEKSSGAKISTVRASLDSNAPTASVAAAAILKKQKRSKSFLKRDSHESDATMTSSDEEVVRRLQKQQQSSSSQHRRRGSSGKEDRVKSPLGHQAVEEQDVGYSNANIFTRFYQGQKVHARHHLRFYDARIVIVKQPTLTEIAKSLVNAYELGKITHAAAPAHLDALTLRSMGAELKDALKNMVNATKCFVHYLGWNSRYDEWLMLHKIRVEEKASTKALESLIPAELPPQLLAAAMDWCASAEGIPALATTHAYASDQQRPRRLSSSGGGRGAAKCASSSSSTALPSASGEAISFSGSSSTATSTASAFHSSHHLSKYSLSHYHGLKSTSSLGNAGSGIKSSSSFSASGSATGSGSSTLAATSSSTSFAYQSPLSASSASRSPSSAAASPAAVAAAAAAAVGVSNLLAISTSATTLQQPLPSHGSGHSSPLSPLQHHRSPIYQQQHSSSSHHHHHNHSKQSHSFDESSSMRQRASTESGSAAAVKFTIPHLQHSQRSNSNQHIARTTVLPSTVETFGELGKVGETQRHSSFSHALNVCASGVFVSTTSDQSQHYATQSSSAELPTMTLSAPPPPPPMERRSTGPAVEAFSGGLAQPQLLTSTQSSPSVVYASAAAATAASSAAAATAAANLLAYSMGGQSQSFTPSNLSASQSSFPIGIHHYHHHLQTSSSLIPHISAAPPLPPTLQTSSESCILLPPPPPPPLASLMAAPSAFSEPITVSTTFNTTGAPTVAPYSVILGSPSFGASAGGLSTFLNVPPPPHSQPSSSLPAHKDVSHAVEVRLTAAEKVVEANALIPFHNNAAFEFVVKSDGNCVEVSSSISQIVAGNSGFAARLSSTEKADASLLLPSAAGRASPLTTVSSCGAVEDFDENSSVRHTETPTINDDDECASIASNDTKSVASFSKAALGSPARNRNSGSGVLAAAARHVVQSSGVPAARSCRNHSKSPSASVGGGSGAAFLNQATTAAEIPRTGTPRTLRRRVASSKSPDSSGAEDNYEEQITHTDSSHSVRLRVQQRMDTEHLFASYSFVGLPELEDLLSGGDNYDVDIKLMEERMQVLRDVYQTYRGKLTRLERRHKTAMAKKRQQAKDAKESALRNNSTHADATNSTGNATIVVHSSSPPSSTTAAATINDHNKSNADDERVRGGFVGSAAGANLVDGVTAVTVST